MQIAKLSVAAAIVLGLSGSVYAADTLADAFKNGKVNGELKAWYWDQTVDTAGASTNVNIINTAIELGYVTDSFYGLRMGVTFQGNATPFAEADAKTGYKYEEWASGSTLSEAYLGYTIGKTDIKIGRQYINTPLIAGNYARIFKESFQGVSIVNNDLPDTTVFANYINKTQGRTSAVMGNEAGDAPTFEKRALFAGVVNATGVAFDGAYGLGAINKSITNLTLTGQYVRAMDAAFTATAIDDVDLYYTEMNYTYPMNGFKLGFDANFRGSKTGSNLDALNAEGHMLGGRIRVSELNGFGASFAATTNSKNDAVIESIGLGGDAYTSVMIRGPFNTTPLANSDAYKLEVSYDFSKMNIPGLTFIGQYQWTDQGKMAVTAGTSAIGTSADFTTYAANLTYAVPYVKGLTTQLLYVTQEKEATSASNVVTKTDTDELWFKANYKF
ncbi:OprD family outer membrane porin [Sulfurospirillum sp. 'SP']|nr:OprD family outer membrane porin [Sulfurospirillum sp. 'SP']WNY97620.1 OprD family outer membrane porin [Sulfurospirillum sp. 'SP']